MLAVISFVCLLGINGGSRGIRYQKIPPHDTTLPPYQQEMEPYLIYLTKKHHSPACSSTPGTYDKPLAIEAAPKAK